MSLMDEETETRGMDDEMPRINNYRTNSNSKRRHTKNTKKNHHHQDYEATLCGLQKWSEHMFEKLGWMVLTHAKRGPGSLKVKAYLEGIDRLIKSIEHRHNFTKDKDTKLDLEIMLENAQILMEYAIKNLAGSDMSSQMVGGFRRSITHTIPTTTASVESTTTTHAHSKWPMPPHARGRTTTTTNPV